LPPVLRRPRDSSPPGPHYWDKGNVFVIDGGGNLRRIRRRPGNWERRETEDDCRFIPENRSWDVDDRERVARAIELYDIIPSDSTDSANERWLKRRAREYCLQGRVTLTADPD
jgi:hypothetical protein